jgi:hypothetical protein
MKTRTAILATLLATVFPAHAQDTLVLKSGERRTGTILSADDKSFRLEVKLGEPSAPGAPAPKASTTIPRADVDFIEFAPDPVRDEKLRTATTANIVEVEVYWNRQRPWLSFPRSPAGKIGIRLAHLLLDTRNPEKSQRAFDIFTEIESTSWDAADKTAARQGRLRAMVATGQAEAAIGEAQKLAAETEDPEILIEANYILAQGADREFRAFLEENPRWDIDEFVVQQRHEIYNRVLALYLYPSLFHGSDNEKAARGLWGAVGIYQFAAKNAKDAGDASMEKSQTDLAIETSRDIAALYPATPEAKLAADYLASLTPEQLAVDFEAEARKELQETGSTHAAKPSEPQSSPTEEPAPEKKSTKKPWKKN